jgi:hypothetical protein
MVRRRTPPIRGRAPVSTRRNGTIFLLVARHAEVASSTLPFVRAGRVLCLAGAALGALGLLGWLIEAPSLVSLVPRQPTLKPITAVALMLLGAAGALRCRAGAGRVPRTLSILAAVAVLAAGAGTLAEYALGAEWPFDRLFFPRRISSLGARHGLPAP